MIYLIQTYAYNTIQMGDRRIIIPVLVGILIFAFTVLVISSTQYASAENSSDIFVNFETFTTKYYTNEIVNVTGTVFNSTETSGVKSKITLTATLVNDGSEDMFYKSEFFSESDGSFIHDQLKPISTGIIQIKLEAESGESIATATKRIEVVDTLSFEDVLETKSFFIPIGVVIASGLGVTVFCVKAKNEHFTIKDEKGRLFIILQFVFISSLVFTPLLFLLFNAEPMGSGPISIQRDVKAESIFWNVTIGGLTIPFFVLILSGLGAYMRNLWDLYIDIFSKAAKGLKQASGDQPENEDEQKVGSLYGQLWRGITLIFVAPILGAALYFVLDLASITSLATIGLSSIAIGLTAENVIDKIKASAKNKLTLQNNQNG